MRRVYESAAIAEAYQAGESIKGLAEQHKTDRKKIREILHQQGIDLRAPRKGRPGECSRCGRTRLVLDDGLCANCRRSALRGIHLSGSQEDVERRRERNRRERNPAWKGGTHVDKLGYIWIRPEMDDVIGQAMIDRRSTRQYVQEHRLVMAHHLGRPLERGEVVHHIDGVKSNNQLSNLRLFRSNSEHHRGIHYEKCPHCGMPLRS